MDNLIGTIERITFQSEETGYTVAKLRPEKGRDLSIRRYLSRDGLVTIVGTLALGAPGERIALSGFWANHVQYGKQFKITAYKTLYPATAEGIRKYLGSGLIKGIGPVTADRIVRRFGEQTLTVIEETPECLLEVGGLGEKRLEMIKKGWQEQKHVRDVMLFLQSHNVSTTYAVKIYKTYGDKAIEVVRDNPYRLAADIWGIGFITADKIARNLGFEPHDPARITAGLRYTLSQWCEEGHIYIPHERLVQEGAKTLEVPAALIDPALYRLLAEEEVVVEEDRVYLTPFYHAEVGTARRLLELIQTPRPGPSLKQIQEMVGHLAQSGPIYFTQTQRLAISKALSAGVLILTGGPGTGKTTTLLGLLALLERLGRRVVLAAPTGRAAKKMSELSGCEARTIHRLLEFAPGENRFKKGPENPLDTDVVIVDEISMVDLLLLYNLLKALPPQARLILIGDADQLPSVGAGNVLKDLIQSGTIEVVTLTEIFRQARESLIVMNAHRVNRGDFPDLSNRHDGDFFFIEEDDPVQISETIRDLCVRRLPDRYRYDPVEQIQVLTPMYRGDSGAINLNRVLQEALNPKPEGLRRGGQAFRVGDKVMQTRNNYDKMVFNGDIGRIQTIDVPEQSVSILFDSGIQTFDFSEMDELVLAYAISVHKSQGSEYPVVVLPLTTSHYIMLQRNLLYTAITRARELVVVVGSKKALAIAVKNNRVMDRYTTLCQRLKRPIKREES